MATKLKSNIQWGSIVRWPGRLRTAGERERAPFKSGYDSTLTLLDRELRMVSAESVVIQLALEPHQFTADGRPYARAGGVKHPGVIVTFSKPLRLPGEAKLRKVPLSFPADKFLTWETNLRAVAIALEDLRRIDRYGVTQTAEQYQGFKALPGPMHQMPTMTTEEAAQYVARNNDAPAGYTPVRILNDPEVRKAAIRSAKFKLHPDRAGNDERAKAAWEQLQEAERLLDALDANTSSGALVT
jgi:hypothetical protein